MALLAGCATGKLTPALVEVAAVSEMIHIATLLHDDVLDEADFRRNKKTVRALWGNTVSVLSGDYLLAQASLKLAQVGNIRIVAVFSNVLADLCDGEVEQIRTSYQLNTDWNSYFKKTICKTASLFAAGCEAAGIVNGLPEEQVQALKEYGKHFGIAFQIMDDLLDYTSSADEMGKPVLDDLRNGLVNAPVLLALDSEEIGAEEKARFKQGIQQLFEISDEAVGLEIALELKESLFRYGAIDQTVALANRYANEALSRLDFIADCPEKTSLTEILQANLRRKN
jgi:geranylgeranyl pyrophosphate synthase